MVDMQELISHFEVLKLEPGDRLAIKLNDPSPEVIDLFTEAVQKLGERWGIEILILGSDADLIVVRED